MSSSSTPRGRASKPHNQAAPMSHTAPVQPVTPGARECDIRRPSGALSADLTFAKIAGSMDGSPSRGGDL